MTQTLVKILPRWFYRMRLEGHLLPPLKIIYSIEILFLYIMFLAPAIKNCQGSFDSDLRMYWLQSCPDFIVNDIKSISWFFPGFHLFVLVFKKQKQKTILKIILSLHKS